MLTDDMMEGLSSKVILVIDDQNSMRSVLRSYFRDLGFERVEAAIDGKDGLTFLMQNSVDLVVCDWHMPKVSGLELLEIVRAHDETKNLPFLMVTSTSDVSAVKNALKLGVSDYMIKPFRPAQLGYKAVQLLSKSKHSGKKLPVQLLDLNDKTDVSESAQADVAKSSGASSNGVAGSPSKTGKNAQHTEKTTSDDFDGTPIDLDDVV